MLMIKDLDVSRELDVKAMSAVRGGFGGAFVANVNSINAAQAITVDGGKGPTTTNVVGPTINNTSTAVNVDQSIFNMMPSGYSGYSNPHGSYDYGSSNYGSSGYGSSGYGA
jgi:hypothetical protein